MDWLDIPSDENQDMHHEFIGSLIMKDGFKVRYKQVELYTDALQNEIKRIYGEHGYSVTIKYSNTYAYCEVTAVKKPNIYGDIAMFVAVAWAIYRVWIYVTNV